MPNFPANLDYTDKDFDSLRLRLISLIRSAMPEWTDFEVATFGNILLESIAFTGDVSTYYMDSQAEESRLPTVKLRKNIIALVKLIGFQAAGAVAATTDELFSLAAVPANDVIIPAGTVLRTRDVTGAVEFQLLLDLTIPAGADPPQAFGTIENSADFSEDPITSTGLGNQEYVLTATPYLDGSALVTAGNGAYVEVANFLSSTSTDKHYTIDVDENDQARIKFGNGVNGEIPTGSINIDYKTGGGTAGNVEENTIQIIDGAFTDVLANPVIVTVNNPDKATGGDNRQTVAQIKAEAPETVRVSDRTVALEDFEIGARQVSGVARALMLTSDQVGGIPENSGFLYVIPVGGGVPSQAVKDNVLEYVTTTKPHTVTFKVTVADPIYKAANIAATVYLEAGVSSSSVRAAIDTALADFFAILDENNVPNEDIDFGYRIKDADGNSVSEIPLSDIFNVVRDVTGVRKIGDRQSDFTINGVHEDFSLYPFEFPALGTVSIINGATGQELQ